MAITNPRAKSQKYKVRGMQSDIETIKEHSAAARKLHPGFDKLSKSDKLDVAVRFALRKFKPDDPDVTDKAIRNMILSSLGVAAGEFDEYTPTDKDSAGRAKTLKDQKEQNPAGFAAGGMVHRGRKAMRGAD